MRTGVDNRRAGMQGRGFTLIELLVAIGVIAVLVGLLTVAGIRAVRMGRETATRQTVLALKNGVDQFKTDHRFLPPLIMDEAIPGLNRPGYPSYMPAIPLSPARPIMSVVRFGYAPDPADATKTRERDFLQGYQPGSGTPFGGPTVGADDPGDEADRRYSTYSLGVYIAGLGEVTYGSGSPLPVIDGVQGPGSSEPNDDGSWEVTSKTDRARSGKTYGPRFQDGNGGFQIVDQDFKAGQPAAGRVQIVDRNGVPIRFYRWMHGRPGLNALNVQNASGQVMPMYYNVPKLLGDPTTNAEFAAAEYAIVAAGPNKYFGDMPIEAPTALLQQKMAGDLGVPNSVEVLVRRAREDNVVEVGR